VLEAVWVALGGEPSALERFSVQGRAGLGGPLACDELAVAAVASALLAAAELAEARTGHRPDVSLDAAHVADAVRSERFLRLDGQPTGPLFDPLSAFHRTADGWVRLHANYPHHRAALLRVLGLADEDLDAARTRLATWSGADLEDALAAAGGVGAVVRSPEEWAAHPAGAAVAQQPLVSLSRRTDAADGGRPRPTSAAPPAAEPARGYRVVDLTRVIAGPVATRTLAALGADVLRVDPPGQPELPFGQMDTGPGKLTVRLDLRSAAGLEQLHTLLAEADALVSGYRPGALAALGLGPDVLAERHPHLVSASLSAWGDQGPWGARRGFDSIVQAATGIAQVCQPPEAGPDDPPGALPAQLLDHATGHLTAAAVLRGLAEQERTGHRCHARLSLAATASYLLAAPRVFEAGGSPAGEGASGHTVELQSGYGVLTQVAPPGRLDGTPLGWPFGAHAWGTDEPHWPRPEELRSGQAS
jgi:CoA transferase family III